MTDLITFYWSNDDLAKRDGKLPLDVARSRNYALDQQVRARGNPTAVVRVESKDRTLFRLTWSGGATIGAEAKREATPGGEEQA